MDYSPPKELVWRIDQPSELIFKDLFQVFPASTSISVRLKADLNPIEESYLIKIKIFSEAEPDKSRYTVLLTNLKNGEIASFTVAPNSEGAATVQLPSSYITGKLEKFSVALTSYSGTEASSWGIQIEAEG
jgi:hypothetical protein